MPHSQVNPRLRVHEAAQPPLYLLQVLWNQSIPLEKYSWLISHAEHTPQTHCSASVLCYIGGTLHGQTGCLQPEEREGSGFQRRIRTWLA